MYGLSVCRLENLRPGVLRDGSGPARALGLKPRELYEAIGYEDDFEAAVLVMESDKLPDDKVIEYIAKHCSVDPET